MASQMPLRAPPPRQPSRQLSTDPRNELHPHVYHYIGIDVGTGSARACIMNDQGDIVGLASENIGLWQPQTGYYVCACVERLDAHHSAVGAIHLRHLAVHLLVGPPGNGPAQH